MEKVKQVIIIRREFIVDGKVVKMRRGKEIAQASHASLGVVLGMMQKEVLSETFDETVVSVNGVKLETPFVKESKRIVGERRVLDMKKGTPLYEWLTGRFTKICVYCKDEAELLEIYKKAQNANIPSVLITDAGLTEFNNVPTRTCVGIGPFWATEIDKITGSLPLL